MGAAHPGWIARAENVGRPGLDMKHAVTRTLYDYWTRLRGRRTAPSRFEIEPGDIRHILGDTFILEAVDRQTYNFRLAGTRLCAAYGCELKGRNLLDMWTGADRDSISTLLAAIVEDGAAAVIGLDAINGRGQSMAVEVMMLPLAHEGSHHTRILGCFAPIEAPYWLGVHPVVSQPVHSLRMIWPDERANTILHGDAVGADVPLSAMAAWEGQPRRWAPVIARRVAHLRVFEGGRR
jgi:hypothetical protein